MSESRESEALRALAHGEGLARAVAGAARPGAGIREMTELLERVRTLAEGTGPELARVLADPLVTDVLLNSGAAWVDRGSGLERLTLDLGGEQGARALAVRMAAACGRRLDDASPIADGTLPGGVRLHAVLSPPSASGTLVSLRCARARGLGLSEMEAAGSVAPRMGTVLRRLVEARANVLVSGATGSGKTTLLAALLGLVPADERIVCIEEVPELAPEHPHALSLVERRPNVQGRGAIPLAELVRAAMRMRPDRLVLGECRGPEVRDVLLALNTGHDGGWATIHANGTGDVPARLQALGALAGLSDAALAAQAVAALDAVVHMRRAPVPSSASSSSPAPSPSAASSPPQSPGSGGPGRWVAEIGVLARSGAELRCDLALAADRDGRCVEGPGWEGLARVLGREGARGDGGALVAALDVRDAPAPAGAG